MFNHILRTQRRLALSRCTARNAIFSVRSYGTHPASATELPLPVPNSSWEESRPKMKDYPPSNQLFIGGVPENATIETVREPFKEFGKVLQVSIGPRNHDLFVSKYAHVTFQNKDDAIATYESAQEEPIMMHGLPVRVGYSAGRQDVQPTNRLYIGVNAYPEKLRSVLLPFKKDVTKTLFMKDHHTRELTGSAFVTFSTAEVATAARESLRRSGYNSIKFANTYGSEKF